MPVTAAQLTPSILTQLNARGIVGPFAINLATGVSVGIEGFVQTLVVNSSATGTIGVGTGTGKWVLEPVSGSTILSAEFVGLDIKGLNHPVLAQGIAFGTSIVVNSSALVQTAVPGVAIGAGTGSVSNANAVVATGLIYTGLTANGVVGTKASMLARAIGQGLATWFKTGRIVTVIAGTPTIPTAVGQGVGLGKIV